MREIKLYEFIKPPMHPQVSHLTKIQSRLNIPSEFVVTKPEYVIPQQARIYYTNLYILDGDIVGYDTLAQEKPFQGTSHYDEVLLVEVWMDDGDDGHVNYVLRGWMYVPASRLQEELDHPIFKSGTDMPLCMFWGENYLEQYEHLKKYAAKSII